MISLTKFWISQFPTILSNVELYMDLTMHIFWYVELNMDHTVHTFWYVKLYMDCTIHTLWYVDLYEPYGPYHVCDMALMWVIYGSYGPYNIWNMGNIWRAVSKKANKYVFALTLRVAKSINRRNGSVQLPRPCH